MSELDALLAAVEPVDNALEPAIRAHLDDLTKPRGSLGRLEALALQYGLVTQSDRPTAGRKRIVLFAADHGVVAEGVSAFPAEVTGQMVRNMAAGGAAICVLTRHAGIDLELVDIGVKPPLDDVIGIRHERIKPGTDNMAAGPAMCTADAERALLVGAARAHAAHADGVTLIGAGDMGIGNTTASAALMAALLPADVATVTGRGTGIDDAQLAHKTTVIQKVLAANRAALNAPLTALAAVGGFEIAGMCGLMLGAAAHRMVVVVDGFIASAAALVACRLCPSVRGYLFFSHCSEEAGHRVFLDALAAHPILDLGLRLGEGTGAALAMPILESALHLSNEMATFSSACVSDKE